MPKLCGDYTGPNRALPCARVLDEHGHHDGRHENFPGNPAGISWPQRWTPRSVPLTPEAQARIAKTRGKFRNQP